MLKRSEIEREDEDGRRGESHHGGRSLADVLKAGCADLHHIAERSGIMPAMLAGKVSRAAYVLFLRNLFPIYRQLEAGLEARAVGSGLLRLGRSEVYRARAIESDLIALHGADWESAIAVLPECESYRCCVEKAAGSNGLMLAAHAYVRFLGDLNGGLLLGRILPKRAGLIPEQLSFHRFPEIEDPDAFKRDYRSAIDNLSASDCERAALLAEARAAFTHNIALSEAVLARYPHSQA